MKRYAHKVDANQARTFKLWRDIGANVEDTSGLGNGFPDAVVSFRGQLYLVEVKDGDKPTTPAQDRFIERQGRQGVRVCLIRNDEDALAMLGVKP